MRCNREQQQESAFIQGKILQSRIIFALQDLLVSVSFLIIVAIVPWAFGVRVPVSYLMSGSAALAGISAASPKTNRRKRHIE